MKARKVRKTLAVAVASVALALGAALPAHAGSTSGRTCAPVGSFGSWYAAKYLNNQYVGSGPRRITKTGALGDCRDWILGI